MVNFTTKYNDRKKLLGLILFLVCMCASCASQKVPTKKLLIINGLFFYEKPEQVPTGVAITISMLKDSIWGGIPILNYPQELSDAAKKYAIPVEEIKNGKEILERAKNVRGLQSQIISSKSNLDIGDSFPNFTLYDINGRKWTQKDLKGKKVVINFWYTGCGPCIKEMPELGSWVRKHRDVIFLAVTFESAEKIKDIVKKNKFHFHQLVDDKELRNQVGVSSYPFTLVLNEDGRITHIEVGTSPVQRANLLKALE